MVRSRWIKAVMATLVSTGLALGQSTTPTSPQAADDATGRIITVHEAGKPAQKCRVIKWWVNDKGCKVWQVQALDTGEMMTIVAEGAPVMGEAPSEGRLRSLRTQIFHWSRDRVPPPGAPTAPVAVCDSGCSPTGPMLSAGSRLPIVSNGPCASDTTCPTCTPTTGGGWSRSTGVPCDNCKPSTGSSVASSGWGSGSGPSGNSSGTTWGPTASAGTGGSPYAGGGSTGGDTRIPVIINVPPSTAQSGTPGTTGMPALPAIESKGPGTFPSAVTTTTTPVPPKPPTETAKPPEIKVTQAEPSALSKWRESWGKSESPRQPAGDGTKGAETKKPQPDAKKPGAEAKVPAALSLPKVDTLPHADTTKPDPLLGDPTQYAKKPIEEKLQGKGSLPPADPVPAPGVRSDGSAPGRAVVTPVPGTGEQLSGGFKSVTDSGAVGYATVPIVTLPAGGMGRPPMPQWQVPQGPPQPINPGRGNAPEALQGGIGYNAFTPRELTPPAPGTPAQSALGNAFSSDLDPVQPAAHAMPAGPPAPGVFGPGYPPYPMMAQADHDP